MVKSNFIKKLVAKFISLVNGIVTKKSDSLKSTKNIDQIKKHSRDMVQVLIQRQSFGFKFFFCFLSNSIRLELSGRKIIELKKKKANQIVK